MWFVKFYAPWCGHCKALEPDWRTLAETLDGKVIVARLDCTANAATADRFKEHVTSFPTLLLFRNRKMYKFAGARTVEAMSAFATADYASSEGGGFEVPVEPSQLQRLFSASTRQLALLIIRVHEVAEDCMKIASRDVDNVRVGWKNGGFKGAYHKMGSAMAATPKMYGCFVVAFALGSICSVFVLAIATAPHHARADDENGEDEKNEKKNN